MRSTIRFSSLSVAVVAATLLLWSGSSTHAGDPPPAAAPDNGELQAIEATDAAQARVDSAILDSLPQDAWVAYFDNTEKAPAVMKQINDPLEKINRVTFYVNDALYRWFIDPTGKVYGFIIPVFIQKGIRHIVYNAAMPVRLINNVFQGKFGGAGRELLRFLVNTTVGIGGIFDPATKFHIKRADQDTGRTFGKYGFGNGFYFVIPFFGPSTGRDALGKIFDTLEDPTSYLPLTVGVFIRYNEAVLTVPEYEEKTGHHFDAYSRLRDYYVLLRKSQLREVK